MKYTAGEAATATGLNTSTITRAIKTGRISATKSETGAWQIDPAELHRVFLPIASKALQQGQMQEDASLEQGEDKSGNNTLQGEIEVMRKRLAAAEQRAAVAEAQADERAQALAAAERNLADLRRMLPPPDAASAHNPTTAADSSRRPWWWFWS